MAKGQTNQPLVIWVAEQWLEHPKIMELREKGHFVRSVSGLPELDETVSPAPDLILHPAAWRWSGESWPYLDDAIKEARRERKRKVKQ